MNKYIDGLIAFRILFLLVQPFDKTDAFKLGIIDKDGTLLKSSDKFTTDDERNALNPLVRLVFNLKRIIGKVPGGKSMLASLVAAYFLIKEGVEHGDLDNLDEKYINLTNQLNEGLVLIEEQILVEKFLVLISEEGEAPVNSMGSGAIATKDNPMKLVKRNNWKDLPSAFGAKAFEVSSNSYDGIKNAKSKGAKWDSHLPESPEDSETYEKIKQYSKTYSKNPIILKRSGHENYTFLKVPN